MQSINDRICPRRQRGSVGGRGLVCVVLALGTVAACGSIPLPQINTNNIVNITNYGAVGDAVTTNTTAIQNAINAAAAGKATNGLSGGTVEIPAGVFISGPLTLKNYVNLQIDSGATLQMLPYGSFPASSDFISAGNLHDLEISGPGTIDGQGAVWWATNNATPGGISRPKAMFAPSTCTTVLVRDVTFQNPPNTHISFRYVCQNVTVDHININTPLSPNTDGIDCSADNVLIENSHISDGDDHVALGDGHAADFNHDITITNCLLGNGHGISIGSYTTAGLSNLLVVDCVWTNGSAGIKVKSDIDRGGVLQNLRYYNLAMTNTQVPIYFYSYYTNSGTSSGVSFGKAAAYPVFPATTNTPVIRNVVISNFTAMPATGFFAGIIWGRPEMCVSNFVMDHVNITASKYFNIYNARGVQFIDSRITATTKTNFGLFNAGVIVTNRSPSTNFVLVDGICTNGYGNSLAFYNGPASLSDTNVLANGPVTVAASTLTVSNNLALQPANVFNFTLGTNAATVAVKGRLTLGGQLNVSAGDGFTNGTYSLMTYAGSVDGNLPSLGSVPTNFNCALDTNTAGLVKLVVGSVPQPSLVATNLSWLISGNQLQLSWPPDHLGWRLEVQTNGLAAGLGTNWVTVPGSTNVNQANLIIDPGMGSVFYRMVYP